MSFEEANDYANKKNMKYLEVSAKTGQNIKKLFEEMIKGSILNIIKKGNMNNPSNPTIRLSFLDKEEQPVKNERCC